ncbi:TerC family protein [Desulfobulbus oligotrophicus]|jgi:predicted tellurium resistance membrane protein TerC|uniref:TerC family protein n=1 Tax=Desulfobulbus oligotrophicus TaxID=1909699 RepID=A0A7T6AQV5_9BACT|nr:TerC family protein [Desulfobulbus oligotrophicus]MDY0389411.1 TerC family protein [Desulfobulbus oligotrophicus]QQG65947.1 TerC family protein [Desulfobulbus oligotrophicus]
MEWIWDINIWSSLVTLTVLEIVLGIDNIIFITLLAGKLPEKDRKAARQFGLLAALGTRILLLMSVVWLARLVAPLFVIMQHPVSGRDLVLLGGGLFLIYKAVVEIHNSLEGGEMRHGPRQLASHLVLVILQIAVIDIIFSLDSVITAVGLADHLWVMITAIVIAIGVMMVAAGSIGEFVDRHPTVKMLALSFLVLVGVALVAEGTGHELPKGYLYFAMAFSFVVEMLNLRLRKSTAPVHLYPADTLDRQEEPPA